jgi:cell division protein ZapA
MGRRTVEVRVGGQKYRVVSSAGEDELRRLAETVNSKLIEVAPGGGVQPPQSMLLAALALAHEVEEERARRVSIERRTGELLRHLLAGLDEALGDHADPGANQTIEVVDVE